MTRRWRIVASTGERVGQRVAYSPLLYIKRRKYTRDRERSENFCSPDFYRAIHRYGMKQFCLQNFSERSRTRG